MPVNSVSNIPERYTESGQDIVTTLKFIHSFLECVAFGFDDFTSLKWDVIMAAVVIAC